MISASRVIKALAMQVRSLKDLSRHPFLLPALAGAWFLYVFRANLPALFPLHSLDFYLRRTGAYDVLLVLWFAAAAYCVGKRILRLIGVSAAAGAEETAFSMAAGIMFFSYLTMVLAFVHGLYRPVAYALLLVPTVIWQAEMRRIPGNVWRAMVSKLRSASWSASACGQGFLSVYVLSSLGVLLLSALGPSFEYDDLTYHLTGPKNFIQNHRFVPLPDVPLVFFPKNIEMLNTLAMLWHSDLTAKMVVFLLGSLTMLAVYGFSVRFLSRASGMPAVAILASSPLFLWEMKTAHNDLGLTFFVFLGVYATVLWLRTRGVPWLRWACFCLAFSLGAKYWAILALAVTALLVFVARLCQSRSALPAINDALRLGLYSSLGLVPWGLVNLYYTGNPVFPLLNGVFHSPYWTSGHTQMALGEMFQGGIRITLSNWWDLFRLPWEMLTDQHGRFGGNIGPWYVMFLPLLLLFSGVSAELWILVGFGTLYYAGWAVGGPWVRFLLPALPALATAAAFAVVCLIRQLRAFHRIMAITAAIFLGMLAVLASPFFEDYGSWSRYGYAPIYTLPFKYLAGHESKDDFLSRFYDGYKAVQYLNQIPGSKKVFYVHTLPDGFYLDGKAAFHYSPYTPGLVGQSADYIYRVLRQNGVTHVVVEQPNQQTSPLSSRESEFTHHYLRKLYQRNAHIVYQLLPGKVEQDVVFYDFLDHLEEARVELKQPGNGRRASREVRAIGDDSRYAMVTVPRSEVEFSVSIPDHAILSFAAGRENPGCRGKASFQVWISPSEGDRRLVYNRVLEGESSGWIEDRVDLAEYAGRHVAVVLKTVEDSPCCDYYWADPVLIAGSDSAQSNRTLQEALGSPEPNPVVSGVKVMSAKVKVGQSYDTFFSGPALTSETYFDIRYLSPGSSTDEVAFNWQRGTSSRHIVGPSTQPGKWVFTGIRAHRGVFDHEGEFNPLRITLEVTR
jgi:hypothetical protein